MLTRKTRYEVEAAKPRAAYAICDGKLYQFPRLLDRDAFVRDRLWDDVRPLTRFQAWALRLLVRLGL
jgi:hypothetical protein